MKSQMEEFRKKWFQKNKLIVLFLAGILLLVIAIPTGDRKKATTSKSTQKEQTVSLPQTEEDSIRRWEEEYRKTLESRLKDILSQMEGMGEVEVMITLKSSQERIVEKDDSIQRKNTSEEDGTGGKRVISQSESTRTTVYDGEKKSGEPFVVKTVYPSVEGVLVVAQGADSGKMNTNITEIAKALFGVEAHKIKVVKRRTGK